MLKFLLIFPLLLLLACKQKPATQAAQGPPVVPVAVARATQESVPREIRAVGSVESAATAQIRSQVAGQLVTVHFTEGQSVAKDQLLFEIDRRPFEEALKQAEAAVVRDRAEIRQAQATLARDSAQLKNAMAEAGRYDELSRAGVISRSQHERVQTDANVYRESTRASEAVIERAQAALQADLAAVDKAKLELSWCSIRAPFAGRTGAVLVHAGNLVKANDTVLVVLHQISPIYVTFTAPERYLNDIRRLSSTHKLGVSVDALRGQLALIDNAVDSATGTIRLKAAFDNRTGTLWPGQFVNAVLTLDRVDNATVVPAEAIQTGQQGSFVYVVKNDQSVEIRPVVSGASANGKSIVQEGVKPGEVVVTDGHLRIFPGAKVKPVDSSKIDAVKL